MGQPDPGHTTERILHTPADLLPGRKLFTQLIIGLSLLCAITAILWLDRDGLRDQVEGEIMFSDVGYFSTRIQLASA